MHKTYYTEKPEVLMLDKCFDKVNYTISINIEPILEEGKEGWQADTRSFWLPEGELDPETVKANPEQYLYYDVKKAAKVTAQTLVDNLRNNYPVVPVPSFREGAAVCHRPADDVKMLGGVLMGGLPYFELASGEVVSLTQADLENIMKDVTTWEISVQTAKQTAWTTIEVATTQEAIDTALKDLETALQSLMV